MKNRPALWVVSVVFALAAPIGCSNSSVSEPGSEPGGLGGLARPQFASPLPRTSAPVNTTPATVPIARGGGPASSADLPAQAPGGNAVAVEQQNLNGAEPMEETIVRQPVMTASPSALQTAEGVGNEAAPTLSDTARHNQRVPTPAGLRGMRGHVDW